MPRKLSHSQNFLRNPKLVANLIKKAQLKKEDIIYEIGPGKGTITFQLARLCQQVIGIEFDPKLYQQLKKKFNGYKNIKIIKHDFLQYKLPKQGNYKIFSNIPFDLTTDIIEKITTASNPPIHTFLIMQKESAKRFSGFLKESLKSLLIKPFFELRILSKLKRNDFKPKPKVNAVLLRIKKRAKVLVNDKELYKDFIVYSLSQWQPNLQKALSKVISKEKFNNLAQKINCPKNAKPRDLKFEQWLVLFKYFEKKIENSKKELVTGSYEKLKKNQHKLRKIYRTRR